MAHTLLWPKKSFFYAIGNTPAISLTQDLSPEENASVLLLGSGDLRNILYTIHVGRPASGIAPRNFDFTCCDIEPAILARNIILFTMIADDGAPERIPILWNIFYHFYIDNPSLSLLTRQCQKLIDVSDTMEHWAQSQYGHFLRICSAHTLSELRRLWTLYARTERYSKKETQRFKDAFKADAKAKLARSGDSGNFRSAGPLWQDAIQIGPDMFKKYWETGLVSSDPDEIARASNVNPTFAFATSNEAFPAHYGTDPIQSYHLAEALAPIGSPHENYEPTKAQSIQKIIKSQFSQWCISSREYLTQNHGKIHIRFFVGDAIAFCQALRRRATKKSFLSDIDTVPWSAIHLAVDGEDYGPGAKLPAPLLFNIIDSSNLTDHIGLINVLLMASPLLSRRPSSALYTEVLLSSDEDETRSFKDRICADIPAMSLLLGIAPSTYLSKFSTHSNVHEILSYRIAGCTAQFHERVSWKVPFMGDHIATSTFDSVDQRMEFEPRALAKFFFNLYLKMFADEDLSPLMQGHASKKLLQSRSKIHYVRQTFAELLRVTKSRVCTDWTLVMNALHDSIAGDTKLLVGSNSYQDLCCQLHHLDVHSVDTLLLDLTAVKVDKENGIFRRWSTVPPVVYVLLQVPRSKLQVLEEIHADVIGTPALYCDFRGTSSHSIFSSVNTVFGNLRSMGTVDDPNVALDVDPLGWEGAAPLVLSFWMPAWILMTAPQTAEIGLAVRSTPATFFLAAKLGLKLSLYSAPLTDTKHVFVIRDRPWITESTVSTQSPMTLVPDLTTSEPNAHRVLVTLDAAGLKVTGFTAHWDIVEAQTQAVWSSGAAVKVTRISPCAMTISFGNINKVVVFPFPVDGSRHKLRIARKSFYIEVVVPISNPSSIDGYNHNNFPIIKHETTLSVWNIHYLNLDRIPALNAIHANKINWITIHVSLMLSDRERGIMATQSGSTPANRNVLVDIKETLQTLVLKAAGVQGQKHRVFALTAPSMGGIYTLIFVTDLRLDLASHTVVVDASIIPVTRATADTIFAIITSSVDDAVLEIKTVDEEMRAWKCLLPALTERCRTWKHKDSCEYFTTGNIPLSKEFSQSPICSCGQGVGLGAFRKVKAWKPLAKYATRAAFSPFFALSYLDKIGSGLFTKEPETSTPTKKGDALRCDGCGVLGGPNLLLCSGCKQARYCSSTCQQKDWKSHKPRCK